jgi:hypothetical protein
MAATGVFLTQEMLGEIEEAVSDVAHGIGWGRVSIVIEKGRPVKLEKTESDWLGRRQPAQSGGASTE